MKKIVWTFGLIAGGIMSAMMLLTLPFHNQIGFNAAGYIVGYTSMVLAFLMVYFGVRTYRDNAAGGRVTFGRAFLVGLWITLIGSLCYVVTWELIYYFVTPDFMDKYAAFELAKARAAGASAQELAAKATQLAQFARMYRNPLFNAAMTLIEPLPVGLVFTLVSAGIVSRKKVAAG